MGIALGLVAGIMYGASDFIGGLASRRSPTFSVVVISQLIGLIALVALLPVLPAAVPARTDLIWGLSAGLGGGAGLLFLYQGLAVGRMSVVSPITAVVAAVIPLAVGLFLGERPSTIALTGVGVALVSVVLVSSAQAPQDPAPSAHRWLLQAGVVEALLAGVAIGAFYVCLARSQSHAGLWPLAGARVASTITLSAIALGARRSLVPVRGSFPTIASAGLVDMLANAFYLIATRHGLLSIVAVLASLYPASTVLLARVVLRERLTPVQVVGVVCALIAVALIAGGA
jgi:drug/metabolite transporter (DMT)-like permease